MFLLTQTYAIMIITVFFSFKESESRKVGKYIFFRGSILAFIFNTSCSLHFLLWIWVTIYYHFTTKIQCYFHLSPLFGGGIGNLLQYSFPGNPVDRGAWQAIVLGIRVRHDFVTKQQHLLCAVFPNKLHFYMLQASNATVCILFYVFNP